MARRAALETRRGRSSTAAAPLDYTFYVENERVRIVPRKRGAPLDKLVAEMMILVNTAWGELLAERDVAAIYRVQSTGKVRLPCMPSRTKASASRPTPGRARRCAATSTS